MKTKQSYTTEQKADLIEKYRSSGLSQSEFARQNNLRTNTLNRWLVHGQCNEPSQQLIKLQLPKPSTEKITICKDDIKIEIPSDISEQKLLVLIRSLSTI